MGKWIATSAFKLKRTMRLLYVLSHLISESISVCDSRKGEHLSYIDKESAPRIINLKY